MGSKFLSSDRLNRGAACVIVCVAREEAGASEVIGRMVLEVGVVVLEARWVPAVVGLGVSVLSDISLAPEASGTDSDAHFLSPFFSEATNRSRSDPPGFFLACWCRSRCRFSSRWRSFSCLSLSCSN